MPNGLMNSLPKEAGEGVLPMERAGDQPNVPQGIGILYDLKGVASLRIALGTGRAYISRESAENGGPYAQTELHSRARES